MCVLRKAFLLVVMAAVTLPSIYSQEPSENNTSNMIVGGFKVDIEEVPYQAALVFKGAIYCGGSIIGPRWILTSYHCVDSLIPSNYQVVVGTVTPRNGKRIQVQEVIIPPDAINDKTLDIAMLKLVQRVVYSKAVQCIPLLAAREAIVPGKPAYISGYGSVKEKGTDSPLKAATINVLPWQNCQQAYPKLMQEHMLCAGFAEGSVDACQGDSGGPLVLDRKLAGVVFFGYGCARPNLPGVYISIPWFYDWIAGVVEKQSSPEEMQLC